VVARGRHAPSSRCRSRRRGTNRRCTGSVPPRTPTLQCQRCIPHRSHRARSVVPAVEQPAALACHCSDRGTCRRLHQVVPAEHVTTQAPPLQSCPAGHVFPQDPAIEAVLGGSVQVAAVGRPSVWPHRHREACSAGELADHPSAYPGPERTPGRTSHSLRCRCRYRTQRPLHKAEPLGQLVWQVSATQTLPTAPGQPAAAAIGAIRVCRNAEDPSRSFGWPGSQALNHHPRQRHPAGRGLPPRTTADDIAQHRPAQTAISPPPSSS